VTGILRILKVTIHAHAGIPVFAADRLNLAQLYTVSSIKSPRAPIRYCEGAISLAVTHTLHHSQPLQAPAHMSIFSTRGTGDHSSVKKTGYTGIA
jgi:hypothetical protein